MRAPLSLLLSGLLVVNGCKKESKPEGWNEVLGDSKMSALAQVKFASEQAGWVIGGVYGTPGYAVLLHTVDAGQTWQRIDLRPYQVNGFTALSAVTSTLILACGPDLTSSSSLNRRMYQSSDGGKTWRKLSSIDFRGAFDLLFFSERIGLAVTNNAIQRTEDGGDTWRTTYTGGPVGLSKLRFLSPQIGYAAGGVSADQINTGTLLRTTDGGTTWQQVAWPHGAITELQFAPGGKGYLTTGDNRLFTSADQGITWQPAARPLNAMSSGWFVSAQEGYFGGQSGIWHTTDAGITWQLEYAPQTMGTVVTGMSFPSEKTGLALTNTGLILRKSK
ncbi:WD40/YVTN/BNR-like repeat-containing protein [Hymenobacter puniceus]|uniref:WD40/YVTN/BNR-like repeat-containing protein n=1 Tax=Hymenobacter sp. BT190 TaxID=2763505 RepID=UPI0016516A84|nr:YCF48-related protein [Hymenobacter sp. BT190]MBC6700477.1 hypothetical protein [Hymenobacter sp. BT190]